MEHIDITFDLETLATVPTAAVMSIAAVAWNRYTPFEKSKDDENKLITSPFLYKNGGHPTDIDGDLGNIVCFGSGVDLRDCLKHGLTFDTRTIKWWNNQSNEAKNSLTHGHAEVIYTVISRFFSWINDVKEQAKAQSVCLWSQGSDFDVAILRNLCHVVDYDLSNEINFHNFRDCRTVICENQALIDELGVTQLGMANASKNATMVENRFAYKNINQYKRPSYLIGCKHNPHYDCIRSAWATWISMCNVRSIIDDKYKEKLVKADD